MSSLRTILGNAAFREDFARLRTVTLDPARHSAPNARVHSEAVARRARELSERNGLELVTFMVADRVDCPGGWRSNEPLVWFIEALRRRGLLPDGMILDAEEVST